MNSNLRLVKSRRAISLLCRRNNSNNYLGRLNLETFSKRYRVHEKSFLTKLRHKNQPYFLSSCSRSKVSLKSKLINKIKNNVQYHTGFRKRRPLSSSRSLNNSQTDFDLLSQWSVPLDDKSITSDWEYPIARSYSQHNDFNETSMDFLIGDKEKEFMNTEKKEIDKQEPHLNCYVNVTNRKNENSFENSIKSKENSDDDLLKDEDNIFDGLCQSGKICCHNSEKNDLLFCAEIQRDEIMEKAFIIYVNYLSSLKENESNSNNMEYTNTYEEAEIKWKMLTQKERLPFLLQAYISDYMPSSSPIK